MTTLPLPAEVTYGRVVGTFIAATADGPDVGTDPDGAPAHGTVSFTPDSEWVRVLAASPVTVLPQPVICTLDANGVMVDPMGAPGVTLMASDNASAVPSEWPWIVTVDLVEALEPLTFKISVPSGGVVDLTTAAPADATVGIDPTLLQQVVDALAALPELARKDGNTYTGTHDFTGATVLGVGGNEVRSESVHPYTYMGAALTNTAESDPSWRVRRIATFDPYAVTEATGAWTDRLTLTYV